MNAVILAGGFGSRLQPLTDAVPKPLLPVAGAPMLDYCCAHLAAFGIRNLVLTLGYKAEQIIEWMAGYSSLTAHYIIEDVPLGTAGGVKEAQDLLDERFIVVSGDALENVDYAQMLHSHIKSGKLATMAVTHVDDPRAFGVVKCDRCGAVTQLIEKPTTFGEDDTTVNCGIYILERAALRLVPKGVKFDFSRDLFPKLIERGQVNAFFHSGYWSDIGTPRAYYDANFAMLSGGFFSPPYNRFRDIAHKIGHEKPSLVSYSAPITGHISGSIVAKDACIASGASVDECIVLPSVTVKGRHSREIIGDGFTLAVQSPFSVAENEKYAQIGINP